MKIGRDLLSLDDWAGQLSNIKSAERSAQEDAAQHSSEQIKEYMSKLLSTAVLEGEKLDGIFSAIQNQTQQQEQRFQDEKDQQCLKDLYETNPTEDKKRIQDTKGDLLRDSYSWILDHADFNGTIWIWRADTGEYIRILEGHNDGVASVTFSHDSKLIASASYDTTIRIWRADIGECIRTLDGHSHRVFSVAFSHNSQLIASASQDKTIRIWRTDTGECIRTLEGHTRAVVSVAFSHDSQLIASAASDHTMRVWSAETGECVQMHGGEEFGWMTSVAFSHDSTRIASAADDGKVRIWRVNRNQRLQATLRVDSGWVRAIAISRNLKLVATAEWPRSIRIWHVDTLKCIQTIDKPLFSGDLSFEQNDTLLEAGDKYFAILDNTPSIRSSADLPPPSPARLPAHHAAYGLKDSWVTLYGEKMLRLPAEFYPNCWKASESVIAIGCMSGLVILRRS